MKQLVRAHCHRAAVRLATLHTSHPLYKTIHKAAKPYPKKHPSPIHNILHISKIKPHSIENIDFRPRHPSWNLPLSIEIGPTRDEACQADRDSEADIKIYMDGSVIAPGLCTPVILGLPFLSFNKLVIDYDARTCIDKRNSYDLLNPACPSPPDPSPPAVLKEKPLP